MDPVMVLGDTHGNTLAATQAVDLAKDLGTKQIFQVGDFGLWDHKKEGVTFLDTLNERCRLRGVTMRVVGGNHENWDRWDWYTDNNPKDYHGFTYLRSHIRIAPKVLKFGWNGKRILFVGGAVSVDKAYRKPGTEWWAGEQLTDAQVYQAMQTGPADFLFTHDCSNATPFRGRLKPDLDSMAHRQKIDSVLRAVKPRYHFHGHMHTKYDWENLVGANANGDAVYTQTYGLECDGHMNNMGLLDLDTGNFLWRADYAKGKRL